MISGFDIFIALIPIGDFCRLYRWNGVFTLLLILPLLRQIVYLDTCRVRLIANLCAHLSTVKSRRVPCHREDVRTGGKHAHWLLRVLILLSALHRLPICRRIFHMIVLRL